jgi:hypothetical protein
MSAIQELKHSIEIHIMIMGGPSPELAVFLLKIIDFLEDDDQERLDKEMNYLAFAIVEAIAIHVQKHIDKRRDEIRKRGGDFPEAVAKKNGDILIAIGKARHIEDKVEAKIFVLQAIADALRELSTVTKSTYPTITNSYGKSL